jgi:hypothetical protein
MMCPAWSSHIFFSISLGALLLLFFIVTMSSCKDEVTDSHTSTIIFPDSVISFTKHVQPLFRETCLGGQCHSSYQPAKNLNLETDVWHSLIDYQPQIVLPRKGKESLLIMYLDGRLQPQMPLRSQPLTQNQVTGVKKWIDEGALPN